MIKIKSMVEKTYTQIKKLNINLNLPLVIIDADEVIVHFAKPFILYLNERGWALEMNGYSLNNSIKNITSNKLAGNGKSQQLVIDFIKKETHRQPITEGAFKALNTISKFSQIVILTNVPQYAYEDRIENFKNLKILFPIIMNVGPKGPALSQLCKGLRKPAIFIDDNLSQIDSAKKYAPQIYRFHFSGCDMVRKFLPKSIAATHSPKSWEEIETLCSNLST
tara:strand:+ start:239 stop:904 length:666 start_codon:yes stop_codon:yes gene_type:complete